MPDVTDQEDVLVKLALIDGRSVTFSAKCAADFAGRLHFAWELVQSEWVAFKALEDGAAHLIRPSRVCSIEVSTAPF